MNWPLLTLRDIGGIALLIALLAAVLFASVVGPRINAKTNYGFGPEWDCSAPGKGGPVCVKRAAPAGAANPESSR
jgi:hypothetical protein